MAVVVLPRFVAFQGDNNKLLLVSPTGRTPMLEYSADLEFLQRMAMVHEVHVVDAAAGTLAIKYLENGKFWQVSDDNPYEQDTVMANFEGVPGSSNPKALFLPVQLDKQTVALKSVSEGLFCDRRAYNFLLPRAESSSGSSVRMIIKEPVISTSLNNIIYHIEKANIYNRRLVALATQTATNHSSLPGQVTLQLEYSKSSTTSWSNSVTTELSVTLNMNAGTPLIAEGGINISASVTHSFSWGEETTESTNITSSYTVPNVPPGASVRVTVSGDQANCDVPFSYTQLDTLPDGTPRSNDFADGVFSGANVFNIYIEATDVFTNRVIHSASLA